MPELSLAKACLLIDAALKSAREQKFQPLAVVVLDAGGHLIAAKREDGAGFMRHDIAAAKAYGALGMGYGTRDLARRAAANPGFYSALYAISAGQMAPSPGGVLIRNGDGVVIGAAGASGDTGDNDEACVVIGINACALTADPGV